jgi:hypothetical protein
MAVAFCVLAAYWVLAVLCCEVVDMNRSTIA